MLKLVTSLVGRLSRQHRKRLWSGNATRSTPRSRQHIPSPLQFYCRTRSIGGKPQNWPRRLRLLRLKFWMVTDCSNTHATALHCRESRPWCPPKQVSTCWTRDRRNVPAGLGGGGVRKRAVASPDAFPSARECDRLYAEGGRFRKRVQVWSLASLVSANPLIAHTRSASPA